MNRRQTEFVINKLFCFYLANNFCITNDVFYSCCFCGNNFLNQSLVHGLICCKKINQPGRLFALIGRHTFSAAMNLAVDLERNVHVLFAGEPTGSVPVADGGWRTIGPTDAPFEGLAAPVAMTEADIARVVRAFADAARQVPYLAELGVSHLYLSPILTAVPGSMHGYDVVDHTRISEEMGGREGLERLAADAHAAGMGVVVDIVPNHMAVPTPGWHNRPLWSVLRDGLERILRGNTGALVVLGHDKLVESLCTGGFDVNIEFSATRLRELAKMDGAVVVDSSVSRILKAAVQLVPDPSIETLESGTRHRTAERVARQTGHPVVSVSQSMHIIALYVGGRRHVLRTTTELISQANQAMQTLERYTNRLNEVTGTLSALEIEDLVTVRDVAVVLQRLEMVRRIHSEIAEYVLELGVDGRLLTLQLEELTAGLDDDLNAVILDYLDPDGAVGSSDEVLTNLSGLDATELLDLGHVAKTLGFPIVGESLDASVSPRGLRILGKIPRLPGAIVDRLVEHFGSLQRLLAAGIDDLMAVDGVGDLRARTVREGLSRLAESSILERYV